ncbi:sigma-54 interaction domain-containing protein [Desulfomonile tiedjei]|uniref:PAS domain S-box n=1 Tax=Desulfomonile tiedjei (strain ATCC 49306 / DSM 6799 / DCB-1) TaxID=706587 RepID=I4CD88_DESTA|nr:sigma-54-dependent Fis family transcriptional regulator [Desulfomonile tiedjei]AFM27529.1 PAS domain S-box [Desulfomonile tiedjei DSM 6799]
MHRENMVNFWKTIVETMMDGLMVVDADGMIVSVNKATEALTGYTREELIGSPCTILNCDNCSARCGEDNGFSCDLFETKKVERRKCNMKRKDGAIVPIMKNASALVSHDGRLMGAVETLMDLSEIVERDRRIARLSSILKGKDRFQGMIGKCRAMRDVFDLITDAAQSEAPIIIHGESGTGKELVASAIHNLGNRKFGPFVKVNCAALSESLLESELFGHVKGAYTGADKMRKGRFEMAHKGDIFLDEIGDIPLSMQVKILRVLQEKEIERVGDSVPIRIDARIISATHRDLTDMIAKDLFREDLFYRLNVIPIRLPPLRERMEDLPLLVEHLIEENRLKTGKRIRDISGEAMETLMHYQWPGNIRELINAFDYAFVVCRTQCIELSHLPDTLTGVEKILSKPSPSTRDEVTSVLHALSRSGGSKSEAAKILGISRQALWKKMAKLGIKNNFHVIR